MEERNVSMINRDAIPGLVFDVDNDVLTNEIEKNIRARILYRAMLLGNSDKYKVKIIFLASEGAKKVETTIWAVTDKSVILKGGTTIPICCIKDIQLV